ncbi:hypothetical protein RAZWK3B_12062 [Roseobacter sp. AzwK-3b]|nr:hypothetical protein RAZWK3B_12062 [Roseobacter sp. AzwK-3b]
MVLPLGYHCFHWVIRDDLLLNNGGYLCFLWVILDDLALNNAGRYLCFHWVSRDDLPSRDGEGTLVFTGLFGTIWRDVPAGGTL